jgi:NAD(P)-dependent dehydrogenase (short-subunit alcohol dehydrogenase family)
VYGAAKAGLTHLVNSLAIEWGPKVRLNTLIVGLVATENAESHYGGPEGVAAIAKTIPAHRMGTPEDVAGACLMLGSPLAGFISGAAIAVHGGGESPHFLAVVAELNGGATDPITGIPTTS